MRLLMKKKLYSFVYTWSHFEFINKGRRKISSLFYSSLLKMVFLLVYLLKMHKNFQIYRQLKWINSPYFKKKTNQHNVLLHVTIYDGIFTLHAMHNTSGIQAQGFKYILKWGSRFDPYQINYVKVPQLKSDTYITHVTYYEFLNDETKEF